MATNGWIRIDRLMRASHLYTGLFLVPWMIVYALSAGFLNHNHWFIEHLGVKPPEWKVEREVDFTPDDAFPHVPAEQAKALLQHLELDGAHRVQSPPTGVPMIIFRFCGSGNYRITWRRHQSRVVVEKQQPFSWYRLVHFLHFRAGYGQRYAIHIIWGVIVDAVAISILIWTISGVYIWARRPKKRLLGSLCLAGGCLLFTVLVALLCS